MCSIYAQHKPRFVFSNVRKATNSNRTSQVQWNSETFCAKPSAQFCFGQIAGSMRIHQEASTYSYCVAFRHAWDVLSLVATQTLFIPYRSGFSTRHFFVAHLTRLCVLAHNIARFATPPCGGLHTEGWDFKKELLLTHVFIRASISGWICEHV
jgi:hypothetical protein